MDDIKKTGYIAAFGSLLFFIVLLVLAFNTGWNMAGQLYGGIGLLFGLLSVGSFWKPDSIGQITHQILKNMAENAAPLDSQHMSHSPGAIQQKAGRDAIINKITKQADVIIKQDSLGDRKSRNKLKEEEALREVYKKMIRAMSNLNVSANIGLKNKEDYDRLQSLVDDFISAKQEHAIDLDSEIMDLFNSVMGSFRHTLSELYTTNVSHSTYSNGLHGLKSFEFINRCSIATVAIKQKLNLD